MNTKGLMDCNMECVEIHTTKKLLLGNLFEYVLKFMDL